MLIDFWEGVDATSEMKLNIHSMTTATSFLSLVVVNASQQNKYFYSDSWLVFQCLSSTDLGDSHQQLVTVAGHFVSQSTSRIAYFT